MTSWPDDAMTGLEEDWMTESFADQTIDRMVYFVLDKTSAVRSISIHVDMLSYMEDVRSLVGGGEVMRTEWCSIIYY